MATRDAATHLYVTVMRYEICRVCERITRTRPWTYQIRYSVTAASATCCALVGANPNTFTDPCNLLCPKGHGVAGTGSRVATVGPPRRGVSAVPTRVGGQAPGRVPRSRDAARPSVGVTWLLQACAA